MKVLWLIPISGVIFVLGQLVMELRDILDLDVPGWWQLAWRGVRWRYVISAAMFGILLGAYLASLWLFIS